MIGEAQTIADQVCLFGGIASDVDFVGDHYGVIDLDVDVTNGAVDFQMAEQELHRAQVASTLVNQHRLCSDETDAGHPLLHQPVGG